MLSRVMVVLKEFLVGCEVKAKFFEKMLIKYLEKNKIERMTGKARDFLFIDRHLTAKSVGQMLGVIKRKNYYGLVVSSDQCPYGRDWKVNYVKTNSSFR